MIPPEVLNSKSLFTLLYKIDLDLAEQARARHCPFAGDHYIALTICESLGVGPLILKRFLKFALACAAAVRVAVAVCCRRRCGFGVAGSTGPLCCFWSVPFDRGTARSSPWSGSRRFAGYGVQRSSVGNATFGTFLPRASATGAYPGV